MARGGDPQDLDPVLGRTLAETQALNSPNHRAGEAARAVVGRAAPDAVRRVRHRRAFLVSCLIVLALLGCAAWLTAALDR